VFKVDGSYMGMLLPNDPAAADGLGGTVAISGTTIVFTDFRRCHMSCTRLCLSVLAVAITICLTMTPAAQAGQPDKVHESDRKPSPRFSFGIVADVQYADKPDRPPRLYRASLERLRDCVTELNRHRLDFTVQLGDLIDGNDGPEKSRQDLERVLGEFARLDARLYHVVGNHCLNAGREALLDKLTLTRPYYDFVPERVSGWRMIVLDGNDAGYGVLGEEQTAWLKETLDKARRRNERVILFNHFALIKKAASRHRMKNPEPIRSIIRQSGCVVAYFAGHDHAGGHAEDGGIQHVTFQGMVESARKNAYAIVDVFDDRIEVRGFGTVPCRTFHLKNLNRRVRQDAPRS